MTALLLLGMDVFVVAVSLMQPFPNINEKWKAAHNPIKLSIHNNVQLLTALQ